MSKITSVDGTVYEGRFYSHFTKDSPVGRLGRPGRGVLWPEGAPDPSTVPHVDERCQSTRCSSLRGEVRSTPYRGYKDGIYIQVMWDGTSTTDSTPVEDITRIPDSPTIEVGGKQYREDDVIERCAELEEV